MKIAKAFIGTLLWIWQFPQNVIGALLVMLCTRCKKTRQFDIDFYYMPLLGSGVCLGEFIIIDELRYERFAHGCTNAKHFCATVRHEAGHQKQSRMLGIFYLPVIGIPSLVGNIYSRIKDKDDKWYYAQPWESWADKLGGVTR